MDIGGSHVTAALIDLEGGEARVCARGEGSVDPAASRGALLDSLSSPARALGTIDVSRKWAVAIPGPFDYEVGSGTFDGVGKFESLAGVDLREALAQRLEAEPSRIRFINDAVAYGIGEWAFGSVNRPGRMLCITLGTGVGSAFLDRGRAVSVGPDVPRDGNVHTLEIDGRPLEETVSSAALSARYEALTGEAATVEQICAAARIHDPAAVAVLDETMRALGGALAPWIPRFEATHLAVGGSISRSWDVVGAPLRRGLASAATGLAVVSSALQADAPLLGAAAWRRAPE